MSNSIPRRNRLDQLTPAELAIYNAAAEIEKLPADERLTLALNQLQKVSTLVANYVDGTDEIKLEPISNSNYHIDGCGHFDLNDVRIISEIKHDSLNSRMSFFISFRDMDALLEVKSEYLHSEHIKKEFELKYSNFITAFKNRKAYRG